MKKIVFALLFASAAAFAQNPEAAGDPGPQVVTDGTWQPTLGGIAPASVVPQSSGAPMFPGWGPESMPQNSWAVSDHDFQQLLVDINNQTFASNQLPMIQAAGLCGWFTCSQCAALMNLFDFDENRLKVVSYLAPHLIDPIRCQPIMDQLSFISDRQTAWNIISAARQ